MNKRLNNKKRTKAASRKTKRGKNFKIDQLPDLGADDSVVLDLVFDASLNIPIPKNALSLRNIALYKHKGQGFDPLLPGFYRVFNKAVSDSAESGQKTLSLATVGSYFSQGLAKFSGFLTVLAGVLEHDVNWSDINKNIIEQYISHLDQGKANFRAQRSSYTSTKSLLVLCFKAGLLPHITIAQDLFPKNPYPYATKSPKGQKPFSQSEFKRLAKAVRHEYKLITEYDQPLNSYELSVCILALALRTGINLTPALEMPVDCLQPHPLKEDRMILVWFKRRGNNTYVQAARKSDDVAQLKAVLFDVVDLITLVRSRNEAIRKECEEPERLFVYKRSFTDNAVALISNIVRNSAQTLVKKHGLLDDDGKPLKVNLSRLRKTFVNRIFDLSGGDPLVTARHGHHSLQTANNHYWEAPREAEANHKKMMDGRVQYLIETDLQGDEQSTPLAHCRDTLNGHRAPRNGEHCTELLACFRCKSFVVTKDDLHRLYSFYWSLIEDRRSSYKKEWSKRFRHIRQVIDENIAPQFNAAEIDSIKADARTNRHPFWKDLTMLRMAR